MSLTVLAGKTSPSIQPRSWRRCCLNNINLSSFWWIYHYLKNSLNAFACSGAWATSESSRAQVQTLTGDAENLSSVALLHLGGGQVWASFFKNNFNPPRNKNKIKLKRKKNQQKQTKPNVLLILLQPLSHLPRDSSRTEKPYSKTL